MPRSLALIAGLVLAVLAFQACALTGLGADASWTAAITALCAVWWVLEPVPIPVTSLLPFAIFPLVGVLDHKDVAQAYGHTLILLLMGGFIMSEAMAASGAHRRLAVGMVRLAGGRGGVASPRRVVLGFMVAAGVCSMWISNTATVLMLLPVALAVIDQDDAQQGQLAVPLLLGVAYAASIGGMGTPVGTPPNIILMGVYKETVGQGIGFAQWMAMGVPVVLLLLPLAWLWVCRKLHGGEALQVPAVGSWTKAERRVLWVFGLTALAWVTRTEPFGGWSTALSPEGLLGRLSVVGMWAGDPASAGAPWSPAAWLDASGAGDSTVALLAVVVLFLVPDGKGSQLLDWPTARRIPWGLLVLFGGGIAIAQAFQSSGLSDALGRFLADDLGIATWPVLAMMLGLCLVVTFLTEVTSNTATTTLLMPVLAAAAVAADIEPLLLMAPAAMSASCAFMLPVATAPNAIIFGTERVTVRRMSSEGLVLNFVGAAVIAGLCSLLI